MGMGLWGRGGGSGGPSQEWGALWPKPILLQALKELWRGLGGESLSRG